MVGIDSDIILLELRYQRDVRYDANARFLQAVRPSKPAITIYTLMEVLGQLSFSLAPHTLAEWETWLLKQYRLAVIWPDPADLHARQFMVEEIYLRPYGRIKAYRMPFLDALVMEVIERTPDVRAFVTWNARHFAGKTRLPVLTPAEYLEIESFRP